MAKSQETFGKKDKEKNKRKQRQEKAEKMQERKANAIKGKSLDEMMAYVDEYGNISSTPPDPMKKRKISVDDIQIGVPKQEAREQLSKRTGIVSFFNTEKGFGFIKDVSSEESIFVHNSQLSEPIKENDKVNFETENGPKGLNAIKVKKII